MRPTQATATSRSQAADHGIRQLGDLLTHLTHCRPPPPKVVKKDIIDTIIEDILAKKGIVKSPPPAKSAPPPPTVSGTGR